MWKKEFRRLSPPVGPSRESSSRVASGAGRVPRAAGARQVRLPCRACSCFTWRASAGAGAVGFPLSWVDLPPSPSSPKEGRQTATLKVIKAGTNIDGRERQVR
ncbi:hypothetical protein CCHR01_14769 [Colletotrichum chrysophilum]|uniref:Uncharacterized protein n=1 Tax=Colletotrichum chrysophilum TaxID=1836956 RepID=A0AAD9ECE5_9PEZI|nr:hypothetical protein CCHR01_14769 [Colletotrichum chrysophilum]